MTVDLTGDPRWQRLHDNTWICPCCGESHGGLFDLAVPRPDIWQDDFDQSSESEGRYPMNKLTDDLCVVDDEHFFIRGVLQLPIIGAPEYPFGFGVWSSLSKENFDFYFDSFDDKQQDHLGPWFGWFSNQLQGYPDTRNMKCRVRPQNDSQRPLIELEPTDHPLSAEQQNGISLDRILDIYAENGHDMRDALSA